VPQNGDQSQLLRTVALLESKWRFLEQYQIYLEESNVKEDLFQELFRG